MTIKSKRIKEEFGLESEPEAVREYALLNREMMRFNYPLIADEVIDRLRLHQDCILDIGTGLGSLAIEFAKRLPSSKIFAIDLSLDMLNQAKINSLENQLHNTRFVASDAHNLNFKDASFDLVVSFGMLHHLQDPRRVFLEIKRILKQGGSAFIYDLHGQASSDTVKEIASAMKPLQKKAFLESVQEALKYSYLEDILKRLDACGYSLSRPKYSHATIIKNKNLLRQSKLLGRRFSDILVEVYFKK